MSRNDEPSAESGAGNARAAPGAELARRFADLAYQDPLTGTGNRRLLIEVFAEHWSWLAERAGTLALVIVDLDSFKTVNDRFGHAAGDQVLTVTAELLRRHFRRDDVLVRWGGDEFVVLAPGAGRRTAAELAERARDALNAHAFTFADRGARVRLPITFSVGVASFPDDGLTGDEVFAAADTRLYAAKRAHATARTRRFLLLAAIGAFLLASTAVVLFNLRPQPRPAPPPASVTVDQPPLAATAREAELTARIAALQEQVRSLDRELAAARSTSDRDARGERIKALEGTIQTLQEELAARPGEEMRSPATPSPAATAAPSPTAPPATAVPPVTAAHTPEAPPTATPRPRPPVIVPPALLQEALPEYPPMARALRREATVTVRVHVDSQGAVVAAELVGDPAGFGFDEAALEAARRARFRPASRDGVAMAGDALLVMRFRSE